MSTITGQTISNDYILKGDTKFVKCIFKSSTRTFFFYITSNTSIKDLNITFDSCIEFDTNIVFFYYDYTFIRTIMNISINFLNTPFNNFEMTTRESIKRLNSAQYFEQYSNYMVNISLSLVNSCYNISISDPIIDSSDLVKKKLSFDTCETKFPLSIKIDTTLENLEMKNFSLGNNLNIQKTNSNRAIIKNLNFFNFNQNKTSNYISNISINTTLLNSSYEEFTIEKCNNSSFIFLGNDFKLINNFNIISSNIGIINLSNIKVNNLRIDTVQNETQNIQKIQSFYYFDNVRFEGYSITPIVTIDYYNIEFDSKKIIELFSETTSFINCKFTESKFFGTLFYKFIKFVNTDLLGLNLQNIIINLDTFDDNSKVTTYLNINNCSLDPRVLIKKNQLYSTLNLSSVDFINVENFNEINFPVIQNLGLTRIFLTKNTIFNIPPLDTFNMTDLQSQYEITLNFEKRPLNANVSKNNLSKLIVKNFDGRTTFETNKITYFSVNNSKIVVNHTINNYIENYDISNSYLENIIFNMDNIGQLNLVSNEFVGESLIFYCSKDKKDGNILLQKNTYNVSSIEIDNLDLSKNIFEFSESTFNTFNCARVLYPLQIIFKNCIIDNKIKFTNNILNLININLDDNIGQCDFDFNSNNFMSNISILYNQCNYKFYFFKTNYFHLNNNPSISFYTNCINYLEFGGTILDGNQIEQKQIQYVMNNYPNPKVQEGTYEATYIKKSSVNQIVIYDLKKI